MGLVLIIHKRSDKFGIEYEKLDWDTGFIDEVKPMIKLNGGKFNWDTKQWVLPIDKLDLMVEFEKDWYSEHFKDQFSISKQEVDNFQFGDE